MSGAFLILLCYRFLLLYYGSSCLVLTVPGPYSFCCRKSSNMWLEAAIIKVNGEVVKDLDLKKMSITSSPLSSLFP